MISVRRMIRLLMLLLVGLGLPLGAMGSQEVDEISAYEVMASTLQKQPL